MLQQTNNVQTINPPKIKYTDHGIKHIPQGHNLERLVDILKLRRPAGGLGEKILCCKYLNHFNMDGYGNYYTVVGNDPAPRLMFTAHTDTVHNSRDKDVEYRQQLRYDKNKKTIFKDDKQCLGADDGTGIWIMLNMIEAKVPGLYYFFRDEEIGGLGSKWALKNTPGNFRHVRQIISFDRKGTSDIIESQRGDTCCSKEFQKALAEQLKPFGLKYKPGQRGSFTDSATFMDEVPECTNISVGYDNQHKPSETQDVKHLIKLIGALKSLDWKKLPVKRDPYEVPAYKPQAYKPPTPSTPAPSTPPKQIYQEESLAETIVEIYPGVAMDILETHFSEEELEAALADYLELYGE